MNLDRPISFEEGRSLKLNFVSARSLTIVGKEENRMQQGSVTNAAYLVMSEMSNDPRRRQSESRQDQ